MGTLQFAVPVGHGEKMIMTTTTMVAKKNRALVVACLLLKRAMRQGLE
jgi:hypothetical protein